MIHTINLGVLCVLLLPIAGMAIGQWEAFETSFESSKQYENPFMDVQVDVVFGKDLKEWRQPAFWNGRNVWTVRFAFPETGTFTYRVESNDASLNKKEGSVVVNAYEGNNPLIKHGHLRVSNSKRYFEHADGTPFFWMGDTWWKCLSKRLSFDEFKQLTDDRAEKGFSLAQIVCGPYPDEDFYTDWWDNEGGKPYLNREFTKVNLEYYRYADRRIEYMVQSGIVPAIVGGWGRADCDAMKHLGVEGMQRHWRNLIARYGAYPTVWIVGGEAGGESWEKVALYVRATDPYDRPTTVHPLTGGKSVVEYVGAECINFDFLQTGHGGIAEDPQAIEYLKAAYKAQPPMPCLIGEHNYEGVYSPPYTQRYVFWGSVLNGAAGITYGACGLWNASIEGFQGTVNTRHYTTWRQAMDFPGSEQVGLNAKFLTKYPWERFEPHPEWVDQPLFVGGIPNEVRVVYMPRPKSAHNWDGFRMHAMEAGIPYKVTFVDPECGRTFKWGTVMHVEGVQIVFADDFNNGTRSRWHDDGEPSSVKDGQLVTKEGALVVLDHDIGEYLSVSVEAKSSANAGIILNYQDKANFLVGLYSATEKQMYFHQVIDGDYGQRLGVGRGPETTGPRRLPKDIGNDITLTATLQNGVATLEIATDKGTYASSIASRQTQSGKVGLWSGQLRAQQRYDNFTVKNIPNRQPGIRYLPTSTVHIERVPSVRDWVVVMERE